MFEETSSTTLFLYLIVLLLSLILITLLILLVHSGLFTSVQDVGTGKPPLGKVVIAYKFEKGPYNEAGQIFTEATMIAPDNQCLGIYYDDPKMVDSNELRYVVGSILARDSAEVDAATVERFSAKGYDVMTLPEVEYVVKTSFPHVTTLSILIGIHKAYPQLAYYVEERKLCAYPFLEFYDGKDIHFYAPLSKQDEFYAPEVHKTNTKDGRGDETFDSDVNTTLDTSHSMLDDTLDTSHRGSLLAKDNDETNESDRDRDTIRAVFKASGGDDVSDVSESSPVRDVTEVREVRGDDLDKACVEDDDEEDNSSSSSFEVVKDEVDSMCDRQAAI